MNILGTGGTGTGGSHVLNELAKQRVSAKVLTRDQVMSKTVIEPVLSRLCQRIAPLRNPSPC
jgi:uncharacterized protein YbjT (DUF2867 family)